jgi:hypothetical protein
MKVFISWSGDASLKMAQALSSFLREVLQNAKPFLSMEIEKGATWFPQISAELEASDYGILCLTPNNLTSAWMMFEAGALSKKLAKDRDTTRVVPLLLRVAPTTVTRPLSMFQSANADKEGVRKIVQGINRILGEERGVFPTERLSAAFDKWWPELEAGLQKAEEELDKHVEAVANERSVPDMVKEVLELSRSIARQIQRLGPNTTIQVPTGMLTLADTDIINEGNLSRLFTAAAQIAARRHGMAVHSSPTPDEVQPEYNSGPVGEDAPAPPPPPGSSTLFNIMSPMPQTPPDVEEKPDKSGKT